MNALKTHAAWLGLALWTAALAWAGMRLQGYSQVLHPVALPGARGVPGAALFNLLAFASPGALAALGAWGLRDAVAAAGWRARIGSQLLLVSALGFAAQGLVPLDLEHVDSAARSLHATAWSAWWLGGLAGAALLASAVRRAALLALGLGTLVLVAIALVPGAIAQRVAMAAWFAYLALAGRGGLSRNAA